MYLAATTHFFHHLDASKAMVITKKEATSCYSKWWSWIKAMALTFGTSCLCVTLHSPNDEMRVLQDKESGIDSEPNFNLSTYKFTFECTFFCTIPSIDLGFHSIVLPFLRLKMINSTNCKQMALNICNKSRCNKISWCLIWQADSKHVDELIQNFKYMH